MRIATYRLSDAETRAARVDRDELVLLPYRDVGELLEHPDWRERAVASGEMVPYVRSKLAPLIRRPPKIWCVGMNYAGHLAETGQPAPTHPTLFAKFPIALIGASDPIMLPASSSQPDWEVELAVIIGRSGRPRTVRESMDYVAGYTVINDISMRDWQRRTSQFLQGKTFAYSTPLGPELVTVDEAPDPYGDVSLSCTVNGETVQSGRTSEMVFGVAEIVAYVAEIAPLEPGDVIATGTPAGIGALMKPPRFLNPGDVVECRVEGIGETTNTCLPEEEFR